MKYPDQDDLQTIVEWADSTLMLAAAAIGKRDGNEWAEAMRHEIFCRVQGNRPNGSAINWEDLNRVIESTLEASLAAIKKQEVA